MKKVSVKVKERDNFGSPESRRLRNQGWIPGVLYGGGNEGTPLSVEANTNWFIPRLCRSEINWEALLRLGFARGLLDLGWYISFSGVITFKNAQALRDVVRFVPLERMLVETDSPYLAPVPWRGQRNEPMRVVRIAEVVAAQKNVLTKEVFATTTSNLYSLFFRVAPT